MKILFKPTFVRQFNAFPAGLQEEVIEKIELFKNTKNHKQLKVHKLKGRLRDKYSFSVNYKTRIVFIYQGKKTAIFLATGDHDVYDK